MNETVVTEEGLDMVAITAPQPTLLHLRNGGSNGKHGTNGTTAKRAVAVVTENGVGAPISKFLSEQGFELDPFHCEDVLQGALPNRGHELAVFDLTSFDGRWPEACNQLRARHPRLPILVLCERSTVSDRIRGFESGADEFVSKPFAANEVGARVRALLRRAGEQRGTNGTNGHGGLNFRYGDLILDLASRVCYRGEFRIDLSRREFALLSYFVQNAEQILTRERILQNVWGTGRKHDSNVVDVYVNYLRNKTEQGKHSRLIHTMRRKGYVLSERPLT